MKDNDECKSDGYERFKCNKLKRGKFDVSEFDMGFSSKTCSLMGSDFDSFSDFDFVDSGKIFSINISNKKGEKKVPVGKAYINETGIEGDGHSGNWHRQVSMLSLESIKEMKERGVEANPGDFAENLTTEGIRLDRLKIGDVIIICSKDYLKDISFHETKNYKKRNCKEGKSLEESLGKHSLEQSDIINTISVSTKNTKDLRDLKGIEGIESIEAICIKKDTVVLELTQIGKECVHPCRIYYVIGYCIMPREGIFCKVLKPGKVEEGYEVLVARKRRQT